MPTPGRRVPQSASPLHVITGIAAKTRLGGGRPALQLDVRLLDLFPTAAWGATAELVIATAVHDVRAGEVPERRAEDMQQTGERPQGEQREGCQSVKLEPDRCRRHQLGMQREQEDAARTRRCRGT